MLLHWAGLTLVGMVMLGQGAYGVTQRNKLKKKFEIPQQEATAGQEDNKTSDQSRSRLLT